MTRFITAIFVLCLFASSAEARPRQPRHDSAALAYCSIDGTYRQTCGQAETRSTGRQRVIAGYGEAQIIGGRPAGCPRRYCGCGLARYLGLNDPRLNLAWNWARMFPRAHPGPGMAVVWKHHVALIVSMSGSGEALLRDYNSGGGLSRLHERSIKGAVVVNPSSRVASQ